MKKKSFIVFLSVIMLFVCCMQQLTEVSASPLTTDNWSVRYMSADSIIVESGKQFYVGDYVTVHRKDDGAEYEYDSISASRLEATYVSEHPEIIKVKKNTGYAKTLETGKAVVTVSCKGETAEFSVTVVEAGTLSEGNEEMVAQWEKAGKKLAKKLPSELTVENGYTMLKDLKKYVKAFSYCEDLDDALNYVHGRIGEDKDWGKTYEVQAPICACYARALEMMHDYVEQYHPDFQKKYHTKSGDWYEVAVSKANKIVLKYNKKLSEKSLLALYMEEAWVELSKDSDEGDGPMKISTKIQKDCFETRVYMQEVDKNGNPTSKANAFEGKAVYQKGSRKITITPTAAFQWGEDGRYYRVEKDNLKFVKGKTYHMFVNWNGGYTSITIEV